MIRVVITSSNNNHINYMISCILFARSFFLRPVNCFNQLITHARSQDLGYRTSIFGSQDLGFRTSTRGFRTWISGPRFHALNARFQDLDLRTWVSSPRYLVCFAHDDFLYLEIWLFCLEISYSRQMVMTPNLVPINNPCGSSSPHPFRNANKY